MATTKLEQAFVIDAVRTPDGKYGARVYGCSVDDDTYSRVEAKKGPV